MTAKSKRKHNRGTLKTGSKEALNAPAETISQRTPDESAEAISQGERDASVETVRQGTPSVSAEMISSGRANAGKLDENADAGHGI